MDRINPHHETPEPDDADLDTLLAQARWPEPSEASTRRLAAAWAGVSPAHREGRWSFVATAGAAAVAIVSGIVAMVGLQSQPTTTPMPPIVSAPQLPRVDVSLEKPRAARVLYVADWREPTAREWLAMCSVQPRRRRPLKPRVNAAPTPAPQIAWSSPPVAHVAPATTALKSPGSLQAFLHQVADPRTRPAALASLDQMSNPPVEALLNELSNRQASLRYAAARALGRINGPATTSALLDLVAQDVRRREAVAALLCCTKDPDAAAFLAEARQSRRLGPLVRSAEIQLDYF